MAECDWQRRRRHAGGKVERLRLVGDLVGERHVGELEINTQAAQLDDCLAIGVGQLPQASRLIELLHRQHVVAKESTQMGDSAQLRAAAHRSAERARARAVRRVPCGVCGRHAGARGHHGGAVVDVRMLLSRCEQIAHASCSATAAKRMLVQSHDRDPHGGRRRRLARHVHVEEVGLQRLDGVNNLARTLRLIDTQALRAVLGHARVELFEIAVDRSCELCVTAALDNVHDLALVPAQRSTQRLASAARGTRAAVGRRRLEVDAFLQLLFVLVHERSTAPLTVGGVAHERTNAASMLHVALAVLEHAA